VTTCCCFNTFLYLALCAFSLLVEDVIVSLANANVKRVNSYQHNFFSEVNKICFERSLSCSSMMFIWSKIKFKIIVLFCNFFFLIYPCDQSWIFSTITPVFSVTWFFRNHYNMLICCSRNIFDYYQCLNTYEVQFNVWCCLGKAPSPPFCIKSRVVIWKFTSDPLIILGKSAEFCKMYLNMWNFIIEWGSDSQKICIRSFCLSNTFVQLSERTALVLFRRQLSILHPSWCFFPFTSSGSW